MKQRTYTFPIGWMLVVCVLPHSAPAQEPKSVEERELRMFSLSNAVVHELMGTLHDIFADDDVQLAADKRTNTLIVEGNEAVLERLEAVVLKLDGPSPEPVLAQRAPWQRLPGTPADDITVRSPVRGSARIRTVVAEGKRVNRGDVLLELEAAGQAAGKHELEIQIEVLQAQEDRLSQELPSATLELHQAALELARRRMAHRDAMATLELKSIETEIAATVALYEALREKLRDARDRSLTVDLQRAELRRSLLESKKQHYQQHTLPLERAQAEFETRRAELELRQYTQELNAARAQREAELRAVRAELQLKRRQLERAHAAAAASIVHAPADGIVEYVKGPGGQTMIKEGAYVRENQPMLILRVAAPTDGR